MFLRHNLVKVILIFSLLGASACQAPQNAQLPEIHLTTIKNQQIQTKALANKVVLVSFWATSCKSCVAEMPELINTYKTYQDLGFEVLAISMQYDPPAQLVAYTEQKDLPFPVIHDSYGDIARQFGDVDVTPTAYLYNKIGQRINKTIGILDFEALHNTLEQELS